jgi:signal transduction histidine kinase/CheY-like chemotaxis protein
VAADGVVWFDLRGGIGRYDPSSDQFQPFVQAGGDSSQRINDIYEDSQGIIWFGTGGGLYRFDPQSEDFRQYTEKDGLPNSNVQAVLADDEGQLWLSTFRGIARFDPQAGTFRVYGPSDGLPGSEFKPGAAFKTAAGELFFGSTGGLVSFFPADIIDNTFQPPVVLTDLRVLNEPVPLGQDSLLQRPIYATDSITFGPEDEVVSFEFAALSYTAPQNNRYRYWLEGFDKEWNQVDDGRRFANYTNLPAGDYVFHVQGSNSDGLWSDQEVRLNITVLPHWFASRWAIAFYIIGTVAGVVGFYSWRTSSIRRQNQLLERQVAQRTQALSDQAEQLAIAKDRAEAANRTKSVFLSNMSHELRSPLNAILGFAQVMTRSTNLSPENRESLEIISRSGEHLLTLINQVLDLSKIEAGQATLNETDFDLYRLLADVESMFRLQAREQNLQLLLERGDNVPQFIRADEVKLRQVLINLLNNALKFTAEGGVSVRVASSGGLATAEERQPASCHLLFQVEDTGPGIVDAEMEHLFEAFAQTETGRRSQEGTGLGLPISRHFVQLMGGNMSVSSQVGMGSTFQFDIKARVVTAADHPPIAAARRVIALEPGQPHYRILIVDDLPTNRQLLVHLLKPLGFELYEAADGREAIELWQKVEPQLIWMDMRMPVLNGYEATQQIKATTQGQATAVIALTASSLEGERHLILSAGCDDYLRKPFRESEIFDMMSKYLGVRYLYEETVGQVNGRSSEAVLTTADLRPISSALLNKLAEAIESINLAQIDEAMAEIQQELPETAAKLQQLITHFEYDTILKMVEEARG